MSFLRLTDAQTAYKHQLNQDDMRQLRDNQDDHESRIVQLLAQTQNTFADDFFEGPDAGAVDSWIDTNLYDHGATAGQHVNLIETDGSHVFQMTTVATAASPFLTLTKQRCRMRLNQDMAFFMEIRAKEPGATVMNNIMLGLQDRTAANSPSDESDCIAFLKGSSAGKWRFRCSSGGVATETDNISSSNRATWQKLRLEFLRSGSGATLQVRAYIDGSEISGSPFTTNIPTSVVLKPFMGATSPGAGTTDLRIDRWEIRWTAVPVAA